MEELPMDYVDFTLVLGLNVNTFFCMKLRCELLFSYIYVVE